MINGKRKLLLVDASMYRDIIPNVLQHKWNVTTLGSAEEATARLQKESFDAIITDYELSSKATTQDAQDIILRNSTAGDGIPQSVRTGGSCPSQGR